MLDPADREKREERYRRRAARKQEKGFILGNRHRIEGGQFVALGVFALGMAAGYFDHPPLSLYWEPLAVLWHPAVSVLLFSLCYLVFVACRWWYSVNPPAPDLPEGRRPRFGLWVSLGFILAALVWWGALQGLAACAAGFAVALWLLAYRCLVGEMWRHYVHLGAALVPSSIVPPALGWPLPNLLATLFLGALGLCLLATGGLDLAQYYGFVKRVRKRDDGAIA